MSSFEYAEILHLHAAVVSARLVESRPALLSGIDPGFVATLPRASTPGDQILQDLAALNDAETLTDGSAPLAIWLKNAATMAGLKQEALVFKAALARCSTAQPTPSYQDEETRLTCRLLDAARTRKRFLAEANVNTEEVDAEILNLRRKLRDGGQIKAGDTLGDGRYLLLKQLGRGGFAAVWEVYDRHAHLHVAVKILHNNLVGDPIRRDRFFRGARQMALLQHRAILRVLDPRGEDGGYHYFVMQLARGGDLERAVIEGRIGRETILPLILLVGAALAEVHARGLIHRDIKPANILLDEANAPFLSDFDLVGGNATTGGTRGGPMGTFLYCAPEMMDCPEEADARADVYALGMTALFGLLEAKLQATAVRNPRAIIDGLPCTPGIKAVLMKAVRWDPHARFADAAALCQALRLALNHEWLPEDSDSVDNLFLDTTHEREGEIVNRRYILIRRLGTTGAVFEAKDTRTTRQFAVKLIDSARTDGGRHLRQAREVVSIEHPNIIGIHDFGYRRDGSFFVVQDLLRGKNLRLHLEEKRRLTVDEAFEILVPIMGALAAAHRKGVVHRNLKPENIFLSVASTGHVPKLIDFGIPPGSPILASTGKTDRNLLGGTLYYLAPEQVTQGDASDARADVWSLGIILFELLAGRRPIDTMAPALVVERLVSREPMPRVTTFCSDVPPEVADILERALSPSPDERFEGMEPLLEAILSFARQDSLLRSIEARVLLEPAPESREDTVRTIPMRKGSVQDLPGPDMEGLHEKLPSTAPHDSARLAEQALWVNALDDAVKHAHDAVATGRGADQPLGRMRLVLAIACRWLGRFEEAEGWARQAMQNLPRGSPGWYSALGQLVAACSTLGRNEEVQRLSAEFEGLSPDEPGSTPHLVAANRIVIVLARTGALEDARRVFGRAVEMAADRSMDEPGALAWIDSANAELALHDGDLATALGLIQAAVEGFAEAGDARNACLQGANLGNIHMKLGLYPEAERLLREALRVGEPMRLFFTGGVRANLGFVLSRMNELDEAFVVVSLSLEQCLAQGDRRGEAFSRLYLAEILRLARDLPSAASEAHRAIAAASEFPSARAQALAVLANILLSAGQAREALAPAFEAMAIFESFGVEEGESLIRLVHIHALRACGEDDLAMKHTRRAKEQLVTQATRIEDLSWRRSFLENIRENAQILLLPGG